MFLGKFCNLVTGFSFHSFFFFISVKSQLLLTDDTRNFSEQYHWLMSLWVCLFGIFLSIKFAIHLEVQIDNCFSAIKHFNVPGSTYVQSNEC